VSRSLPQTLLVLLVLGALVAVQQLFALPGGSALLLSIQDAMHAPWFFTVVVVLCWWFRTQPFVRRLLIVGGIAAALAVGTEFAQQFVAHRSASLGDLVRNTVGGVLGFVFATVLLSADKDGPLLRLSPPRMVIGGLLLLALGLYAAWGPFQELRLRAYRADLFPVLVDFADERALRLVETNAGTTVRAGSGTLQGGLWTAYEGRQVLEITFGAEEYPTLYVRELLQRWAAFDEVALDLFVAGSEPLPLTVAVQYEGDAGTSAFFETTVSAGPNELRIPRSTFVPDEATGLRVRELLIYTRGEHAGRTLMLGMLRLR